MFVQRTDLDVVGRAHGRKTLKKIQNNGTTQQVIYTTTCGI